MSVYRYGMALGEKCDVINYYELYTGTWMDGGQTSENQTEWYYLCHGPAYESAEINYMAGMYKRSDDWKIGAGQYAKIHS